MTQECWSPLKYLQLGRGFHNLKQLVSVKDIESMISFDELNMRFDAFTSLRELSGCSEQQQPTPQGDLKEKVDKLYKFALDIVDAFIILEDYHTEDLSFFAPPLKPLGLGRKPLLNKTPPHSLNFLPVTEEKTVKIIPEEKEEEEEEVKAFRM